MVTTADTALLANPERSVTDAPLERAPTIIPLWTFQLVTDSSIEACNAGDCCGSSSSRSLGGRLLLQVARLCCSRSVVQYLDNWRDVSDKRGMDIFNKLTTLCNSCVHHLQWIPSHANLKYNDIADSRAKEGTTMPQAYVEPLHLP
ncbi:hypothetical protein AVEN_240727-1 [Araneus ventricosus]|uniref:RNase H type-1 domain-containing protein n=1 Tax=Araneus ventricosus TaxID=182803 RepID=A0A4Y2JTE1_ARAVE|nr:hypothetical protein AVEN_240727-1 [Araneus ventricosus]